MVLKRQEKIADNVNILSELYNEINYRGYYNIIFYTINYCNGRNNKFNYHFKYCPIVLMRLSTD